MTTVCCLSNRYDLNHERGVPEIPKTCSRRDRRILWSMVSKAADRSRSVRIEILPLSRDKRRSFMTLFKAVSVL